MKIKKLLHINEAFSRGEYFIFGMLLPYFLVWVLFNSERYPFVYLFFIVPLFIPPLVIIGMVKRANKIGMYHFHMLFYLTISVVLQVILIFLITPPQFCNICNIKPIFIMGVFIPFQLFLLLMPSIEVQHDKN